MAVKTIGITSLLALVLLMQNIVCDSASDWKSQKVLIELYLESYRWSRFFQMKDLTTPIIILSIELIHMNYALYSIN